MYQIQAFKGMEKDTRITRRVLSKYPCPSVASQSLAKRLNLHPFGNHSSCYLQELVVSIKCVEQGEKWLRTTGKQLFSALKSHLLYRNKLQISLQNVQNHQEDIYPRGMIIRVPLKIVQSWQLSSLFIHSNYKYSPIFNVTIVSAII